MVNTPDLGTLQGWIAIGSFSTAILFGYGAVRLLVFTWKSLRTEFVDFETIFGIGLLLMGVVVLWVMAWLFAGAAYYQGVIGLAGAGGYP